MRQQGGGSYAVGSQTFNVGGAQPQQPTPNPPSQPIQYSGPTPPLPPPQQQQPPAFNPAMAYRLPQPTSPSNPFASMLQNPFQQQNPFSMGGGLGSYMGMPNMGQQQNPQLQLQQMIAMAMAQGALGQGYGMNAQPFSFPTSQGNPYMQQQPGLNRYGSPTIAGQQQTWNAQQQPSIGGYFSSDPGMMQAYYGGGSGGNQPLPQVDFRAATYGGQSQAPQAQQTPSYSQSTPQYGATQSGGASASNPWANINNTLPSLSNSYSYGWGRS